MESEMSKDQIKAEAYAEWLDVLAQLWIAIGKPLEKKRLAIYGRLFGAVPMGLLEKSIERVLRENTWSNVPTPGTIWQALRQELGNPYDLLATFETWQPVPVGYLVTERGREALK